MTTKVLKGISENPYRRDSKLYRVYNFMSDGKAHPLAAISNEVHDKQKDYCPNTFGGTNWVKLDRRVSSALRTIRRECLGVCLVYDDHTAMYQMTPGDVDSRYD